MVRKWIWSSTFPQAHSLSLSLCVPPPLMRMEDLLIQTQLVHNSLHVQFIRTIEVALQPLPCPTGTCWVWIQRERSPYEFALLRQLHLLFHLCIDMCSEHWWTVIVLPLTHWQGGYDLTIGTSERGASVDEVDELQPFRWVCVRDACEMGLTSGANHMKDIRTTYVCADGFFSD